MVCVGFGTRSPGFAPELRRQREAAGLTQTGLAERADVHASAVARFEGGFRFPALATAVKLAGALSSDEAERCRLVLSAGFLPPGYEVVTLRRKT